MSTPVPLPALGESVTEGTVSRWLKQVGDTVEADEPIVEVSTDKVDTEVPSPVAGTILEIKVEEDDTCEVGQPLCIIGDADEAGQSGSSEDTSAQDGEQPTASLQSDDVKPSVEKSEAPSAEGDAKPAGGSAQGTDVTLPALGESVTEGTVSRWLKQVGDTVEADEPIVEVSTDKVDTEVPSPVAGTLLAIKVEEDDTCEVGGVLCVIGDPSAQGGGDAPQAPAEETAPAAEPEQPQQEGKPAAPAAKPAASGNASGTEVKLPALGESVTEGTVSRWLKEVGDAIEADEPIVEVSTDKVDTEVPSPVAGTLLAIKVEEDDTCEVGGVLCIVGDPSDAQAEETPADQPSGEQVNESAKGQEPEQTTPEAAESVETDAEAAKPEPAATPAPAKRAANDDLEGVYVTPLVRKLAQEHGVDLASLKGSGVGGRIRKQDVMAAAEGGSTPAPSAPKPAATPAAEAPKPAAPAPKPAAPAAPKPPAPAAPKAAPAPAPAADVKGQTEKMTRLRQTIARRMTESLQTSAQLTATVEVDLTKISRLRAQVKADFKKREGVGLSYLPFITKAVIEALQKDPRFNATIDTESKTITYAATENIGIAVDTPKGLLVPVIKNAGELNIAGLAKRIVDVAARTRDNQVTPDDLTGGTFTITNYGSAGTLFDTPVINQPEVAILGTGALVKRPVVIDDPNLGETIAVRDMMYLSLTYDHRLIDGANAARFLSSIKARLEEADFGAEFGL